MSGVILFRLGADGASGGLAVGEVGGAGFGVGHGGFHVAEDLVELGVVGEGGEIAVELEGF